MLPAVVPIAVPEPFCRMPLELFQACTALDSGSPSTQEAEMMRAVCSTWREDCERFGNVFELSIASTPAGTEGFRFSYGFPAWGSAPGRVARGLRAMAHPLGDAARDGAERVLRACAGSSGPCVAQPLFGYAREGDAVRVKFYLQFRDGAGESGLRLARAVTGYRLPFASRGPLHLLGLDLGEQGLLGAKFYFKASVGADAALEQFGVERELPGALLIHRIGSPEDPEGEWPTEMALCPHVSKIAFAEICRGPAVRGHAPLLQRLDALGRSFALEVRWVTRRIASGRGLKIYCVPHAG